MNPHDEPGIDPRLRAALDHAPDGELRPPPAVQQAVLRAARAARAPAAGPWRRAWHALGAPRGLAAVAGVASVGIALKLAWSPEPAWLADGAQTPTVAQAPAPAVTTPPPVATDPAPAAAEVQPPPRTQPAPRVVQERSAPSPRAASPLPTITTTTVAPPSLPPAAPPAEDLADAPALAAAAPTPASAPPRREAFAGAAPPPAPEQRAAKALAADALARARQDLAAQAPAAVQPGHPAPLARWAQALAETPVDAAALPAGWQVRGVSMGPTARAWWQSLLAGTTGRWVSGDAPPAGAQDAGQVRVQAGDGTQFSLGLGADAVWLFSEGAAWRAPRPPGLPAPP